LDQHVRDGRPARLRLTAYGVLHDSARVKEGDTVLVQAAGGVGSLAVQLARLAGTSTVIGMVGSEEKRELMLALEQAAEAHRAIEERATTGKVVLFA
jgi:NADPH-dependent curcumin reductase CurA